MNERLNINYPTLIAALVTVMLLCANSAFGFPQGKRTSGEIGLKTATPPSASGNTTLNSKATTSAPSEEKRFSGGEKSCFWTKPINNGDGDCIQGLPVQQILAHDINASVCRGIKIDEDNGNIELVCACVENKFNKNNLLSAYKASIKSVDTMDQDNNRRSRLLKNIYKVFIREHVFDDRDKNKGIKSCSLESRFQDMVKFTQTKTAKGTSSLLKKDDREDFCSGEFSPFKEMGIFLKIEKERLPKLNFEETIGAGLDLIKSLLTDVEELDIIRKAKKPDEFNGYVEIISKDVKVAIKKYFWNKNCSYVKRFKETECNQAGMDNKNKMRYVHLCSILGSLENLSSEQKQYMEIALELITENPEIMRKTITDFVDGTDGLSNERLVTKMQQIKAKRVDELKGIIAKNHQKFCDNIIGSKEGESKSLVDSVKKYCLNEKVDGVDPTIEDIAKTAKDLESDFTGNQKTKALFAKYKFCSSIRSNLTLAKEIMQTDGQVAESDRIWINEFLDKFKINKSCVTTDKKIAGNGLSEMMDAGVISKPSTESRQHFNSDQPNLFSENPMPIARRLDHSGKALSVSMSSGSGLGSEDDGRNITTSQPSSHGSNTTQPDLLQEQGRYGLASGNMEDSLGPNIINPGATNSRSPSSLKNSERLDPAEQAAVEEFRKMDPAKQYAAVKNIADEETLKNILNDFKNSTNQQQINQQQKMIEALEKQLQELKDKDREKQTPTSKEIASSPRPIESGFGNSWGGGSIPNSVGSAKIPQQTSSSASSNNGFGGGPSALGNSSPITLSSNSKLAPDRKGTVVNSQGTIPSDMNGVEEIDLNGDNSPDIIRLSKDEYSDILLDVPGDNILSSKEDPIIEIKLVDCINLETRKNDKNQRCVLLTDGRIVPLNSYLDDIKNKKKVAVNSNKNGRAPASDKAAKPSSANPVRHGNLLDKLKQDVGK